MMSEERYQVRWHVYGAMAAVERCVGNGADDRVWCFLDYGSYDVKIGRYDKNFIARLTTFNLFNLRLSLDCELPSENFNAALLWRGYLYSS